MPSPFGSIAGLARVDVLAQRYGTTPAALLGEVDPYRAYCVNEACALAAGEWKEAPPSTAPPKPQELRRFAGEQGPLLTGTIGRYDE